MSQETKSDSLPLKKLTNAVDVATWAWSIKRHSGTGRRCQTDWKKALDELCEAWERYQIETDDSVLVTSEERK